MQQRGWYPDPHSDEERWHDGNRWTGVTRPTAQSLAREATEQVVELRRRRRQRRRRRTRGPALAALCIAVVLGAATLLDPSGIKSVAQSLGLWHPHRLLPAVKPATTSTAYTILETYYDGAPVTYDPCKPVRYVINPLGAPPNYLSFIQPAIAKAQAASGLKFVYDGLTTDVWDFGSRATASKPVLISFPASLDVTASHADAIGLGGSTRVTINGLTQPHYVTGHVDLLQPWFMRASAAGDIRDEEAAVMHELGHVLGLGHVKDRREIMYPQDHGQTTYGPGDLAGLAKLGSGKCGP